MTEQIRVVLVDETRMFQDGLRMVIEMEEDMQVVGVAVDGAQVPELRKELPVVIVGAPMKIAEAEKVKRSVYKAMVAHSAHGKLYWAEQSGH